MRSIRIKRIEFDVSFTNKEFTPRDRMFFLKQMLQKTGFRELIEKNPDLPQSGSNCGYDTAVIIEAFIASIGCVANRFLHTEVARNDATIAQNI